MKYEKLVGEYEREFEDSNGHALLSGAAATAAYEQSTAAWSSAKILERNQIVPMASKATTKEKAKTRAKARKARPKPRVTRARARAKAKALLRRAKEKVAARAKGKGKSKGPCKTGHRAAECWQRGHQVQQVEGHDQGDHGGNGGGQPSGPSTRTSSSSASTAPSSNASHRSAGTVSLPCWKPARSLILQKKIDI